MQFIICHIFQRYVKRFCDAFGYGQERYQRCLFIYLYPQDTFLYNYAVIISNIN